MSIWDMLRDFYVVYIFGGQASTGTTYANRIGMALYSDNTYHTINTTFQLIPVGYSGDKQVFLSVGDWLSTTFTIITLIVFVCILFIFLRWLFKVVSGLILLKN